MHLTFTFVHIVGFLFTPFSLVEHGTCKPVCSTVFLPVRKAFVVLTFIIVLYCYFVKNLIYSNQIVKKCIQLCIGIVNYGKEPTA